MTSYSIYLPLTNSLKWISFLGIAESWHSFDYNWSRSHCWHLWILLVGSVPNKLALLFSDLLTTYLAVGLQKWKWSQFICIPSCTVKSKEGSEFTFGWRGKIDFTWWLRKKSLIKTFEENEPWDFKIFYSLFIKSPMLLSCVLFISIQFQAHGNHVSF